MPEDTPPIEPRRQPVPGYVVLPNGEGDKVHHEPLVAREDLTRAAIKTQDAHIEKNAEDLAAAAAQATGRTGDTGDRGVRGKTGDTGETGEKGEAGKRGERGDEGTRGDVGPQGESGMWVASQSVLTSLNRLEGALDRNSGRLDGVVTRIDTLVDTTNHHLDAFRESMRLQALVIDERMPGIQEQLNQKADKDELLTSWVEHLFQNRAIRWVGGALVAAVVGTAAYQNWLAQIIHFFGY
jgi:hypothetical protein